MREKCKNCNKPSKSCISYLMTLSTKEMLEWCKMWKDKLNWSNGFLAEKSRVPKGTIDRVFSHAKADDSPVGVKLETIRPIICALIGCTIEELEACEEEFHTASDASLRETNKRLETDLLRLERDIDRLHSEATEQRQFLLEQIKKKDRYIRTLAIALAVTVLLLVTCAVLTLV